MKAFPLRSATICEAAISAIKRSCDSFFLFVQQIKALDYYRHTDFAIQPSWSSQGRKNQSLIEHHTTSI